MQELDRLNSLPGATEEYQLALGATPILDAANAALSRFPMLIAVTNIVVLLFLCVNFGSLAIPLRSALSILVTLCWVYGSAVLVYQHGALDFLHAEQVANRGGVSWMVPLMTFSVITGLGLDYDIFLLDRIVEYRARGHSTHESISLGIAKTGAKSAAFRIAIFFWKADRLPQKENSIAKRLFRREDHHCGWHHHGAVRSVHIHVLSAICSGDTQSVVVVWLLTHIS